MDFIKQIFWAPNEANIVFMGYFCVVADIRS